GCQLQVSPKREGELSTAGTLPRDILVIADFTAPAGVLFDLGVFGRCGASGCVDTAVEGDGSTFMSEREGGGRWLDLTRRRLKFLPGLNRLVLWVGGAVAVAWLNGAEMGRPDVTGGG